HHRRLEVFRRPGVFRGSGVLRQGRSELRIRRHPAITGRRRLRRRAGDGLRNLAQAQVLGEPARGEAVGGAGKQREKGASGGIGLLRSRGEVRGDSGAHERLLEQRSILERRPEQHRHPVERNASLRFAAHQAGNLDAFAAFSRRGEEDDVVARRRNGRGPFDEEPLLHSSQRGVRRLPQRARRDVESARDSRRIRRRGDGQDRSAESGDETLFERSAEWKIDQQRRQIQQRRLRFQGEPEDRSTVGQGCPSQLGLVCVEYPPEISTRSRSREAQLLDRPRKRPGQARLGGDGIEFPQPAAELMDDSRTHGLHAERRQRRQAALGHGLGSNDGGQAPQREPLPAESRPRIGRRAAAFVLTWVVPKNPDGMRAESFREILRYYEEHPYLTVQPNFVYDYVRPEARATLEGMHEDPPVTVDEATRALEQTHLDSLIGDFSTRAEAAPLRRFGLVPARGLLQPGWLTHMFLHFGWMHILGNLFFFYLVGPLLEDLWGRRFFAVFYLVGGLMAALAHFGIDPRSTVLMAGASGAIAACMGAFTYRCANRK